MDGLNHNDISMETRETSIVYAIKAIRSSKKHADELTVYKFFKKEIQLVTNSDISNTFKILNDDDDDELFLWYGWPTKDV